jgi:hypothetical protein
MTSRKSNQSNEIKSDFVNQNGCEHVPEDLSCSDCGLCPVELVDVDQDLQGNTLNYADLDDMVYALEDIEWGRYQYLGSCYRTRRIDQKPKRLAEQAVPYAKEWVLYSHFSDCGGRAYAIDVAPAAPAPYVGIGFDLVKQTENQTMTTTNETTKTPEEIAAEETLKASKEARMA